MTVNDSYAKATNGLANGGDFIVDGSGAGTGAVNVTELGGTADCDIYREVDTAGDGSWAVSVKIDDVTGNWHSQGNDILCSQSQNTRIRINNTSGGTIDVYSSGYEVDN